MGGSVQIVWHHINKRHLLCSTSIYANTVLKKWSIPVLLFNLFLVSDVDDRTHRHHEQQINSHSNHINTAVTQTQHRFLQNTPTHTHSHTPQATAVCLLPSRVHSHTRGVVPSSTPIVREDDAPRISGEMLSDEICRWSVSVITARQHDECDTTTSARTNVHVVWTTRRLDNRLRPTTKHRKLEIKKFYMFVFWKIFLRSSSTGVRIKYWGASTKDLVFKIKKNINVL